VQRPGLDTYARRCDQGSRKTASGLQAKRRACLFRRRIYIIPLNNPRPPRLRALVLEYVLRPPLLVLGFVMGKLYNPCFGWLDKRVARQYEQRFTEDIRRYLPSFFAEHGAEIIPNEGTPFPPSFDGAYVTVAIGNSRLRFVRGRGDFSVFVASAFAPNSWEDFRLVADGISEWDLSQPGPRYYTLETFEPILRSRLGRLQEALSEEHFETTLNTAVRIHNGAVDEYAATLRQSGITPKFY
jgi:hypothetical protein